MSDIATNLRRTRADMLGTDDEEHYWYCHKAAAEIERLQEQIDLKNQSLKMYEEDIRSLRAALERIAKGCDLSNEAQAIAREALRSESENKRGDSEG